MLVIELKFLTGRFHATPWGRNVNEGVPEWPPSPYRLVRSMFDTWKRKRPDWPNTHIETIFTALASSPPLFYLPSASASHTRAFLSENVKDGTKRQKVFDAFVVLHPKAGVLIGWPNVTLNDDQRDDLDELLALVNYFGRSESWVSARVLPQVNGTKWNCYPADNELRDDPVEIVSVACPVPIERYLLNPYKRRSLKNKGVHKDVPWLDAMAWTTTDMFTYQQSEPPAFEYINYARPAHCFEIIPRYRTKKPERVVNGVLYALESKVLPQVVETLEISERVRTKLMGIHKRIVGDPTKVSQKFSGKDSSGKPLEGHKHIYILPLDRDNDGQLDHLLVVCKEPFDHNELIALDRLNSLWQSKGKPDIQCIPLQWDKIGELIGTQPTSHVISTTPFIPPRHHRRGRGEFGEWLVQELRREASNHGLPSPTKVIPIPKLINRGRSFRWLEFRRNRKGDPIKLGYGFELVFPEPVYGPVVLGYGAHFGLGQFFPATNQE